MSEYHEALDEMNDKSTSLARERAIGKCESHVPLIIAPVLEICGS